MNFTTILSLPVLLPAITPGLATPQAPAFPSSIKAPLTATVQLSFGVAPSGQTYN